MKLSKKGLGKFLISQKKIMLVLSFLVVLGLIVGCMPAEEVTDEELEAEMADLSNDELDAVIEETGDSGALAGQAFMAKTKYAKSASSEKLTRAAANVRVERLNLKLRSAYDALDMVMDNYGARMGEASDAGVGAGSAEDIDGGDREATCGNCPSRMECCPGEPSVCSCFIEKCLC